MKNRTKLILLISALCILVALSFLIVFFTTSKKGDSNYSYVNLNDTSINSYNMENIFYSYDIDGYKTSIGVDLSEHNIDVNFKELKNQGIEYAFLRLGWRGYITPTIHLDKNFEEYYKDARKEKIDIGVYFFSQAINEEEAIEEANFVIDTLKDKTIDTYVVFDFETIEDKSARTNNLTRDERTLIANAFLETIEKAGYSPMLYTNYDWIKHHYRIEILHTYPIWYAQYSKRPQYKGKYLVWQYASNIMIDGVSSPDGVDLNIMIKKEETN